MLDEKHTVKLALMLTEVRAGQRRLGKDKGLGCHLLHG